MVSIIYKSRQPTGIWNTKNKAACLRAWGYKEKKRLDKNTK